MATKLLSELELPDSAVGPFPTLLVHPGEDVSKVLLQRASKIKIGAGLLRRGDSIVSTRSGVLKFRPPNKFWVEISCKRYQPLVGDFVVGVVVGRTMDSYRVNICASSIALLPYLAFEGATKRNRPQLEKGAVVYCRVAGADRDLDPELSCKTSSGMRPDKGWMTGESIFGEMKEGNLIHVPISLAVSLLKPDDAVLRTIGAHFGYEVAVGVNGRIWIHSASKEETVVATNAILNSQWMKDERELEEMVKMLLGHAGSR